MGVSLFHNIDPRDNIQRGYVATWKIGCSSFQQHEAKAYCESMGMEPVSLDTPAKQDNFNRLIAQDAQRYFWTGEKDHFVSSSDLVFDVMLGTSLSTIYSLEGILRMHSSHFRTKKKKYCSTNENLFHIENFMEQHLWSAADHFLFLY